MATDDFASLSHGVFVVPFHRDGEYIDLNGSQVRCEPRAEALPGPSRPRRPLTRVYDEAWTGFSEAHEAFEASRTIEQVDDIEDWLGRCSAPTALKSTLYGQRLPVAVVQNISSRLPPLLSSLFTHVHTLHGREAGDLTAAVRGIAVGFMGEAALAGRKAGRTGIDEVERWWSNRNDTSKPLLHIEQAQLVPSSVLAELIYILTLHPNLPIRLLLSVPSTSLFLSTWTHIEPSAINLSVLQAGKTKGKRGGAVNAILRAGHGALRLSDQAEEFLRADEEMFGGGAPSVLKALKWLLLFHSETSPLGMLDGPDKLEELHDILDEVRRDGPGARIPGHQLFEMDIPPDLGHTQDPAPRISILHALSHPSTFHPPTAVPASREIAQPAQGLKASHPPTDGKISRQAPSRHTTAKRTRRDSVQPSQETDSETLADTSLPPVVDDEDDEDADADDRGDLKELQTLFALWRGAGKTVNLWDWLEGFRGAMVAEKEHLEASADTDKAQPSGSKKRKRGDGIREQEVEGEQEDSDEPMDVDVNGDGDGNGIENGEDVADEDDTDDDDAVNLSEHESERLHAAFIRFCEEARMLGLVRARGKGGPRRADEVVKSIGLV